MSSQHEIIKKFCYSQLDHAVHIPDVRAKLYVESTKIFQTLNENSSQKDLDVFADQYLKVLKQQMYLVEQHYGPVAIEERKIYLELERVWMLCQVLYFSGVDQTDITVQLMNWYNKCHKSYLLEFDRQSIYYSQSAFDHADFWPYTVRLILLGQLKNVSTLLNHVLSGLGFKLHKNLARYIEFIRDLTSKDIQFGTTHHDRIQAALTELKQLSYSVHVKYIIDILNILMGNEQIILQYTNDDVLGLITSKFYQRDQYSTSIHEFAQCFFTRHNSNDQSPLRFFLEGNLYRGLECSATYDWWFITHLADLLDKKNLLNCTLDYSVANGDTLKMNARDYFALTYASYLNNQFGLWQESFTYLMTCGELGKAVVIEHLKDMDFQNDDEKLNSVVKFCVDYSMKNDGLILYEKKATICLASKNYEKALQYYNQAEKYQYLDQVFSAVLKDFIHTGKLYDIKLFKDTSNYSGIHYIVYRDISYINQLFLKEQFHMAADIFNCLIKNNSIPIQLMPIIFAEGWKLIGRRSNFTLNDLLEMKNISAGLRRSITVQDFTWYHYYIHLNTNPSDKIPDHLLLDDMTEFFNSTAVIISRAIDTANQ
ncbi:Nup85 nucleoporin-domain-containing protein [Thamnidium elegans]|uniref:Nuclear pore complex protein Nup85 n=1 Tax=Thamnidium elegans TaxID=101142 RepID=A0A8H7SLT8_9FUNG|nr:hypothetical protein INT48_003687 [Thamnidium elegans]KAI8091934.1 Nup85 nucleoporin-domain-containing protein [Thamnidium elegans]